MKFVCQHCKSKYTISDDKIRNKRLKIRCKKCRNIIEIIDPTRTQNSATNQQNQPLLDEPVSLVLDNPDESFPGMTGSLEEKFAASFQKSTQSNQTSGTPGLFGNLQQQASLLEKDDREQAIWFVAIDNTPVGPVSARVVHKYKEAGRVADETLTWKEGMTNWAPLWRCKDLIGLLARIDLEMRMPSSPPKPSVPSSPSPQHNLGLFGAESPSAQSPLKGAQLGVVGVQKQVAEGSAATALDAGTQSMSPAAAATAAPQTTVVGDIEAGFENEVSRLHSLTPPRSGGNRVYLLASVGFFVTAVITLFMVITGGGEATGEPQSVQTVEKIVEKVVYRDRIVEKEVFRDAEERGQSTKSEARRQGSGSAKNKRASQKKGPSDEKTRELMERMSLATPEAGRAPIGSVRSATSDDAAGGARNNTLNTNQMKRVVNRNKGALKSCYERSLKKGEASDSKDLRVNFKMTVGKSGTVKNISLSGEGASLPGLNSCLNRSVKQWVFPATSGESNLEFPFVFTPTR